MLTVSTPAATGDLTTVAALAADLQITDTASDTYLADLIRQASSTIAKHCGRASFGREAVVQTERLTCRRECIILARDIEPAITSVVEDGAALDAADYELDGSLLYRLRHDRRCVWTARKLVVTYSAGFATIPADLERICLDLCRTWYTSRGRDPALRSERILDVIQTDFVDPDKLRGANGLPIDIEARLVPYSLLSVA